MPRLLCLLAGAVAVAGFTPATAPALRRSVRLRVAMPADATAAAAEPEFEEQSFLEGAREVVESPGYVALSAGGALGLAYAVAAGFTDLVGPVADPELCQALALGLGVSHAAACAANFALAGSKGMPQAGPAARGLALGMMDVVRVAALEDAAAQLAKAAPPLRMELSSANFLVQGVAKQGIMLTTQITATPGNGYKLARKLEAFAKATIEEQGELVSTCAVNQDPDGKEDFMMLQRFKSIECMIEHQNSVLFKVFTIGSEDILAGPMRLYAMTEEYGQLGESRYPFGPGGEGGRDDAIYSSPVNIDGSGSAGLN